MAPHQITKNMDTQTCNQLADFIRSIADNYLSGAYVRSKYRDVILPMTLIRRLDALLEDTKDTVLKTKKTLDDAGIVNQTEALCTAYIRERHNLSVDPQLRIFLSHGRKKSRR